MLLERIGFVQTGKSQNDRPRWKCRSDRAKRIDDLCQCVVHDTSNDNHDMRRAVERIDVFLRVVTRFAQAACIKKTNQWLRL